MEFLAASQAWIAAALTVPALIVLYMLRLRRRPVRVSTILFWPGATEDAQANTPLRMLRPSWLLLLHLLALCCILLAFARPVLPGADSSGGRVVLLLDCSASMSARDTSEEKTRLERAKQRAKSLIRDARGAGASTFCVVSMAARSRPLTSFTASTSMLDAAIDSIEQTDQPADLALALTLVDALVSSADEDDAQRGVSTVFLISDGAFAGERALPAISAQLRFERVGPRTDAPRNVGIVRLAARRAQRDATLVRVTAELVSNWGESIEVPVSLAVDGAELVRTAVRLEPAGEGVGAWRGSFMESVRLSGAGVLTLTVNRPDALASDNAASVVMRAARPASLAVVREDAGRDAQSPVTWMLEDVLEEITPGRVTRFTPRAWSDAALARNTSQFDLVVFDGVVPAMLPAQPTLTLGALSPVRGWRAGGVVTLRPDSIYWRRDSVLLRGVTLDSLVVTRAIAIEPETKQQPADKNAATLEVVARSDDTPLLATFRDGPRTHACVLFSLEDSNWPLSPSFAIYLANVVDELTLRERSEDGRAYTTGVPVTVRAPSAGGLVLEGPVRVDVRGEESSAATVEERAEVQVGPVERAGVYFVRTPDAAGSEDDRVVAVNLSDENETLLASHDDVRVEGRTLEAFQAARTPRDVWHWFVLAACALLVIEWIVSARQLRA